MNFRRVAAGCYESPCKTIEVVRSPTGWGWSVNGVGFDAENTFEQAKRKAMEGVAKLLNRGELEPSAGLEKLLRAFGFAKTYFSIRPQGVWVLEK